MTRVAIYARVSTTDQTTENQKCDLARYCESRGWNIVQIFEDVGISGSEHDRPALKELMKLAKRRQFDAVLVWRFDRFARSTSHLLEALQEFQALGIQFISFSEGIDSSTPVGKLLYVFVSAVSEFELQLIRERIKAGVRRAKDAGIRCGRPKKAFDVSKAIELHNAGKSLREIAKDLGVGYATVYRNLQLQQAS